MLHHSLRPGSRSLATPPGCARLPCNILRTVSAIQPATVTPGPQSAKRASCRDGWGEEDGEFDDDGEGYEDEDVEDGEWGTRAKSHRAQRAQRGFGARQIRVKLPGQAAGGPSNNIMFMGMRQVRKAGVP